MTFLHHHLHDSFSFTSTHFPLARTFQADAHHRFTAEESDWGFTRFYDVKRLHTPTDKRARPLIEDDETVISAYVRVLKDPTGVLWHNFVK